MGWAYNILRLQHIIDLTRRSTIGIIQIPFIILLFVDTDTMKICFQMQSAGLYLLGFIVLRFVPVSFLEICQALVSSRIEYVVLTCINRIQLTIHDLSQFILSTNSRFSILYDSTSFGIRISSDRNLRVVTNAPLRLSLHRPYLI